jgi:hypothetical protein
MFLTGLASLIRTMLYGWVGALCRLLKLLCRRRPPPKGPEHRPTQSGCVLVDHPAFVRPDPLLYSQRYLISKGLAVTYDNPDITLSKGGVVVSSHDLEPATTYDVTARIWNNSLEAPAVHMPVHLSFLDFGVGNEPIPIGSSTVDVGVKGSAGQPAFVTIPWTTPPTPGHFCLQVLLDPADDLEPLNNLGQENTDVRAAHSPAVFEFTLHNDTRIAHRYHFEVDAYQLPPLTRCEDVRPDDAASLRRHRRESHPVPAGFSVQVQPPAPVLAPGASLKINVSVDPPAGFIGRQAINVHAFHEQGFAGGVTLTCVKEV